MGTPTTSPAPLFSAATAIRWRLIAGLLTWGPRTQPVQRGVPLRPLLRWGLPPVFGPDGKWGGPAPITHADLAGAAGKSYRAQFKTSLTDAAWQDIDGGVTLTGSQGSFSDPAPAPPRDSIAFCLIEPISGTPASAGSNHRIASPYLTIPSMTAMNSKFHFTLSGLTGGLGRRHLRAFTVIELIGRRRGRGHGALLVLPALAGTKPNVHAFQCLENLRRIQGAITMYTHDNHDLLPPNPDDGNDQPRHIWVRVNRTEACRPALRFLGHDQPQQSDRPHPGPDRDLSRPKPRALQMPG